ncbi:hypothetical protein D3C75_1222900 [compost metagenome]
MDWDEIIDSEPLSFLKACYFDRELREVQRTGSKIMRSIPYLHYSRRPLAEVYASEHERISADYGAELAEWVGSWEAEIWEKWNPDERLIRA